MEINLLISCTISVLQLLIDQYEYGSIDIDSFADNTRLKIKFIKDNLEFIKNSDEKINAKNIIEKCENLSIRSDNI